MTKHIHLVGMCGTAMASLAGMLKQRGHHVTGSDAAAYPPMSDFLSALGIPLLQPFDQRNLTPRPDLVVVGNAISRGNPELESALDAHIPLQSLPQLLHDEFLIGREPMVVAGTHGKTTTSSMLSWIFHSAGRDPSFLVGGICENFGASFRLGQGPQFILEGDEYDTAFFDKGPKFLHYFPDAIILTSVEFDHGDIYADLEAVKTSFRRLVNLAPRRGRIVAWDGEAAPDGASLQSTTSTGACPERSGRPTPPTASAAAARSNLDDCLARAFCPVERYGFGAGSFWRIADLRLEPARTLWTILRDGKHWGDFEFALAGEYNVLNATAAAALSAAYGIAPSRIAPALQSFRSVKRRLEVKAETGGITVIDDFAHHPTAIAETLKALRTRYAGRRLWVLLEPRSNTLARNIFQAELANSLAIADRAVIAGVYRAGKYSDQERLDVTALAAAVTAKGAEARHLPDADSIVAAIVPELRAGDVVAILSNGAFGGIYDKLPAAIRSQPSAASRQPLAVSRQPKSPAGRKQESEG
jgi:UDP-N-acetylmuramate: L-alanyl-gamma-D-glutamyl-meso-diaminopimelate ligase